MPEIAYVNGEFMKLAEAVISIEDRGFQFGDGVYELIRVYRGSPHVPREHIVRLKYSAAAIHLEDRRSYEDWDRIIQEGVERSGFLEAKVYIQLTRGVSPRDHRFPLAAPVTTVMTVRELEPEDPTLRKTGVPVITVEDIRWGRCDIKSLNLLPNVLAKQQASQAGVFEAVFVKDGFVLEGASSTLMMIGDGRLCTPPEGPRILSGITRDYVLAIARRIGLPVIEEPIPLDVLVNADEMFLTGTTIEMMPVIRVNGHCIGAGTPGKHFRHLYREFRAFLPDES